MAFFVVNLYCNFPLFNCYTHITPKPQKFRRIKLSLYNNPFFVCYIRVKQKQKTMAELTEKEIVELKEKHESIRRVLMDNGNEEYGDCIIDEICEVVGLPPTTVYYVEGE